MPLASLLGMLPLLVVRPPESLRGPAHLEKALLFHDGVTPAGEVVLDPDCTVTADDFLEAVPEGGLGDLQSLYLGEHVATLVAGHAVQLVLITRGTLKPREKEWVRALLLALEEAGPSAAARPKRGGKKGKADGKGADLAEREAALEAERKALAKAQAAWKAERSKAFEDLEAREQALKAAQGDMDARVKLIQKKGFELLDLQERLKLWAEELVKQETKRGAKGSGGR